MWEWQTVLTIGGICGAVVTILGLFAMLWRQGRRMETLTEGIMGKPAVTDYAGEVVEKPVPSLQARVGKIEELLIGVADTNNRLALLEAWQAEHEKFSQEIVRKLLDMQQADGE
ncbi:MAG: hypothetical protein H5T76_14525 [Streptomyces sp.]|nr:hypothetical protein [Streptomyces sp.]